MSHFKSQKAVAKSNRDYKLMQESRNFFQGVIESCMEGKVEHLDQIIQKYLKSNKTFTIDDVVKDFKSEGKNIFHIASSSGHQNIMDYFIVKCSDLRSIVDAQDHNGMTALMNATISECDQNMNAVLALGASVNIVNKDGATALHFAAGDGSVSRMKILIAAGADPHIASNSGSALHWAASKGHGEAVKFLIGQGVDVNAVSGQGLPAVIVAAVANSDDCVYEMVKAGANVGHILSGNLTLLHLCSEHGLNKSVSAIVETEHGKKCATLATEDGNLPIHLAAMSEHQAIIRTLLPHSGGAFSADENMDTIIADGKQRLAAWHDKHTPKEEPAAPVETNKPIGDVEPQTPPANSADERSAIEHKDRGNELFKQRRFGDAIEEYSHAIRLHGNSAVYWSNRSACFLAMGEKEKALRDAEICRQLDPNWAKGCYRLAAARLALNMYEDAAVAAFEGCKIDDSNQELKKILQESVKLGREEHKKMEKANKSNK